jgi:hypothetical protein
LIHLCRDGATQVFRFDPIELDGSLRPDETLIVTAASATLIRRWPESHQPFSNTL